MFSEKSIFVHGRSQIFQSSVAISPEKSNKSRHNIFQKVQRNPFSQQPIALFVFESIAAIILYKQLGAYFIVCVSVASFPLPWMNFPFCSLHTSIDSKKQNISCKLSLRRRGEKFGNYCDGVVQFCHKRILIQQSQATIELIEF